MNWMRLFDLEILDNARRHFLDLSTVIRLDLLQQILVVVCDKVDRNSFAAKTSRSTDAKQKTKIMFALYL